MYKQKFQYKTALFKSVKSFISARARRILSYRVAIWLQAAPCWAEPVIPPSKPLPQPLGHLHGLTHNPRACTAITVQKHLLKLPEILYNPCPQDLKSCTEVPLLYFGYPTH